MRFARSAFKHGITEAQIRYVIQHYGVADDVPLESNPSQHGLLFVGDDQRAVALEIIAVPIRGEGDTEDLLIIHAMPLRTRYRPEYERVMHEKWG
jgi:hypothetical protein